MPGSGSSNNAAHAQRRHQPESVPDVSADAVAAPAGGHGAQSVVVDHVADAGGDVGDRVRDGTVLVAGGAGTTLPESTAASAELYGPPASGPPASRPPASAAPSGPPPTRGSAAPAALIARAGCEACHGLDLAGQGRYPGLHQLADGPTSENLKELAADYPDTWINLWIDGSGPEVAELHRFGMPVFGGRNGILTADEIAIIVEYLRTLE